MNLERLNILIDTLTTPMPYEFNMNAWLVLTGTPEDHWCGTECCIAGLAIVLFAKDPLYTAHYAQEAAKAILDLTPQQADSLFYPDPQGTWSDLTPTQGAQAIRNLIKGDEQPWANV